MTDKSETELLLELHDHTAEQSVTLKQVTSGSLPRYQVKWTAKVDDDVHYEFTELCTMDDAKKAFATYIQKNIFKDVIVEK